MIGQTALGRTGAWLRRARSLANSALRSTKAPNGAFASHVPLLPMHLPPTPSGLAAEGCPRSGRRRARWKRYAAAWVWTEWV